jgi:hypothetical protein
VDGLGESLKGAGIENLAKEIAETEKQNETYTASIERSKRNVRWRSSKLSPFAPDAGSLRNIEESGKELDKGKAHLDDLNKKTEDFKDRVREVAKIASKTPDEQAKFNQGLEGFVAELVKTNGNVEEARKAVAGNASVSEAINKTIDEQVKSTTEQEKKLKERDLWQRRVEVLEKATATTDSLMLLPLAKQEEALNKRIEAANAYLKAIEDLGKTDNAITDNKKRELEFINIRAGIDAATGKGLNNHLAAIVKQTELYKEQSSLFDEMTMRANETVKTQDDAVDALNKQLESETDTEQIKTIEGNIAIATAAKKRAQDGAKAQEKALREMFDTMLESVTEFQDTMSNLAKRPEFKRITAELDFSSAQMEMAAFSDDWANMLKQSVALTAQASKERLALEKEALNKEYEAKRKQMEEMIDLEKGTKSAEVARMKAELGRTLEVNKQLELTKKETEQKKVALEAAKQSAAYATEMVDLQQQVTDAQAQFMTEVGGNWQSILDLQSQSVQFEKQKADIAEKLAEDMYNQGYRGKDLAEAQTAAKLAELKYQQKALGAQKSAFEALAGMAFGAIRSSVGIRKNIDTAVMKMGREDTRVKTRSGMYRAAGMGGAMTIDQRAILGQLSGVGAGGGLAGTPKKMTTEQTMEEQLKQAEVTADATKKLADAGLRDKSVYTADTVSQDWLKKICDYTGSTVDALGKLYGYFSSSTAGKGERKAQKQEISVLKDATQSIQEGTAITASTSEGAIQLQGGIEDASKETAGKVSEVKLSLADQLKQAQSDFETSNKQLVTLQKNNGSSKDIDASAAVTSEAIQRMLKIQDQIRVNEMKNPVAGLDKPIEGMSDILTGKVGKPVMEAAKNIVSLRKTSDASIAAPLEQISDKVSGKGTSQPMSTVLSRAAAGLETAASQTATGFAGIGGAEAGGAGTMKVTGEITVKFDSKLFRTQVAQIVGEVIRGGEVRKYLSKQGFPNKIDGV